MNAYSQNPTQWLQSLGTLLFLVVCFSCKPVDTKTGNTDEKEAKDTVVAAPAKQYDRYWNDAARYFGGLEPLAGSVLDSIEYRPEAIKHRNYLTKEWRWKDSMLLRKLDKWSLSEMPAEYKSDRNVFYPFSGPDFVTITTLFPNAKRYVMFGLEIEGNIPRLKSIPQDRLAVNLSNLQNSVIDNIRDSFFYTLDMSSDLYRSDIKGTTPILMFMLARTGKEVLEVKRIRIDSSGTVSFIAEDDPTTQTPNDNIATGVEIEFRAGPTEPVQKLQYFCFNAEDKHFQQQKQIHTYFQSLKPSTTYLKSASYLMHNNYFSIIRNIIMDVSDVLLQDDTGIACRFYDPSLWNFSYYGMYTRPIPIFASYYQADLLKAYKEGGPKSLTFDLGYKSTTNLLLSRRKGAGSENATPEASKP